jgi:ribosomal protein L11
MSNSLVKADTKKEALQQMLHVDQSLANTVTRKLEIEDRKRELNMRIRATKEYEELRELAKEDKELTVVMHEKNGARKMIFGLMKKFGMEIPDTKFTKLLDKNENARSLVQV